MYEYYYSSDIGFAEILGSSISMNLGSILISIAGYVLLAMGLYTIAKRRGIQRPWLAWIPIASTWLLGCISDQYQYVVRHEEKNKRKILLVLEILMVAALIALIAGVIAMLPELIEIVKETANPNYNNYAVLGHLTQALSKISIIALILMVLSIATTIVMYMAYYDLFASCDPNNKTIYLVLGIFFGQVMSLFVFACRKKDFGMPPRRDELGYQPPQQDPWTPPQQTWQPPQPPAEPWEQNRE